MLKMVLILLLAVAMDALKQFNLSSPKEREDVRMVDKKRSLSRYVLPPPPEVQVRPRAKSTGKLADNRAGKVKPPRGDNEHRPPLTEVKIAKSRWPDFLHRKQKQPLHPHKDKLDNLSGVKQTASLADSRQTAGNSCSTADGSQLIGMPHVAISSSTDDDSQQLIEDGAASSSADTLTRQQVRLF